MGFDHKNMVINTGIFLAISMGMCHHKIKIVHDPKMMVFFGIKHGCWKQISMRI